MVHVSHTQRLLFRLNLWPWPRLLFNFILFFPYFFIDRNVFSHNFEWLSWISNQYFRIYEHGICCCCCFMLKIIVHCITSRWWRWTNIAMNASNEFDLVQMIGVIPGNLCMEICAKLWQTTRQTHRIQKSNKTNACNNCLFRIRKCRGLYIFCVNHKFVCARLGSLVPLPTCILTIHCMLCILHWCISHAAHTHQISQKQWKWIKL